MAPIENPISSRRNYNNCSFLITVCRWAPHWYSLNACNRIFLLLKSTLLRCNKEDTPCLLHKGNRHWPRSLKARWFKRRILMVNRTSFNCSHLCKPWITWVECSLAELNCSNTPRRSIHLKPVGSEGMHRRGNWSSVFLSPSSFSIPHCHGLSCRYQIWFPLSLVVRASAGITLLLLLQRQTSSAYASAEFSTTPSSAYAQSAYLPESFWLCEKLEWPSSLLSPFPFLNSALTHDLFRSHSNQIEQKKHTDRATNQPNTYTILLFLSLY